MAKEIRHKFPYVANIEELNGTPEATNGYFVSPGGAATSLGVSRAEIRNLEARGRISGYRMHSVRRSLLPRLLSSKPDNHGPDYVFVSVSSVRAFARERGIVLRGPVWAEDSN